MTKTDSDDRKDGGLVDAIAAANESRLAAQPKIYIKFCDNRPPFPLLSLLYLVDIPCVGDCIQIKTASGSKALYKVMFINFDPYDDVQVTAGLAPPEIDNADQKARFEALKESQLKLFDKATAYTMPSS